MFYSSNEIVELTHSRICIFAAYSANNIIDEHVIYYLKELRKVCDGIIFVADNPVSENEFAKIKNLVIYAQFAKHGKYDFGSYAVGYNWFKNSDLYDKTNELVFCNDSVYGPYYPLALLFEKLKTSKNNMFYGHTINNEDYKRLPDGSIEYCFTDHMQTYFFVLNKSVFTCKFFSEFLNNVKPEPSKIDIIINYELGLTKTLANNGFSFDAYSLHELSSNPLNDFGKHFNQMLFIKRCSVKWFNTFYLNRLLKNTEFPFYILPGKTLNKSALTSMLCKLYLIFEPVRLMRKSSLYKDYKELHKELRRKCAPFKKMILERVKK